MLQSSSRSAAGAGADAGADVAHGSFAPNLFADPHAMDHDDQYHHYQHDHGVDTEHHNHTYDAYDQAHAAHDDYDDYENGYDDYDLNISKSHSHLIHSSVYAQQQLTHHHHHYFEPASSLPTPPSQSPHHIAPSFASSRNSNPATHDSDDSSDEIYADENEDVDMQEGGAPLTSSNIPFDAVADAIANMDDDTAVSIHYPPSLVLASQEQEQGQQHQYQQPQQVLQILHTQTMEQDQMMQMQMQHLPLPPVQPQTIQPLQEIQQSQQMEEDQIMEQNQLIQQAGLVGSTVFLPGQLIPNQATQQLQALQDELHQPPGDGLDPQLAAIHPMTQFMVHPNPMSLSPDNFGLVEFLRHWALRPHQTPTNEFGRAVPNGMRILDLAGRLPNQDKVDYEQLQGDQCDLQGVNWTSLGDHVTRRHARSQRRATYVNYVNMPGSDDSRLGFLERQIPNVDNYLRHRRTNLRRDVRLLHFQLRNILGVASRTRAFYPSYGTVCEFNPATNGRSKKAMLFDDPIDAQVSTLTVGENILMVGGFLGDYRYRYLDSDSLDPTEGKLTDFTSGITNHVQVHTSRQSSAPVAAFASNDNGFRLIDLTTNRLLSETMYTEPVNCTALSPDGRLRAMVGDHQNLQITDADSGQKLESLEGHRDFGFACDWAPNGWTVATGNQDRSIRVWDARKWRNNHGDSMPVSIIRTEMSGARSLQFSPLGSGKRILVAAEEADYINIIDAQTFETKQTFDIFGEIGGASFTNSGQDLFVLSCDRFRGGLLQLERCDGGAEDTFEYHNWRSSFRDEGYDWLPSADNIVELPNSEETMTQRRRKAYLQMGNLDPF